MQMHTSRPWTEPRVYRDPAGKPYMATVYGDHGRIVFHVHGPNEIDLANLTLASAAIDMLEACETALLAVHANRSAVDPAIRAEAEAKLRAAIAKARGQGPSSSTEPV